MALRTSMIFAKYIRIYSFLFLFIGYSFSSFAMNLLLRPYDTLVRPEIYLDHCYEFSMWAERGVGPAKGFNEDGQAVNVLSLWSPDQDALAMLNGFPDDSPITALRLALDAIDDGTRGHIFFDGKLRLDFGGAIGGRWYFLPHAWITAYLPVYKAQLTDVTQMDLTQMLTASDIRVKNLLTNNLSNVLSDFSDGLALSGWRRTGLGDLNTMVEWLFDFPQERPLLKNVTLDGRVGFTWPTGLKSDPDKLFAFPYGFDGAVGILYGGGLDVMLSYCFKAGFDVQLLSLFGNTRERRIRTATDQTDLLLLAKAPAYKDFGLIQRFNLYVQAYHFYRGFSFLAGYQFLKKGQDRLELETCAFNNEIANTAASLEEWIVHSVECNLHYDVNADCPDAWIAPQISLFARLPFGGKRAAAFKTVGLMIAFDF